MLRQVLNHLTGVSGADMGPALFESGRFSGT
jgi:hypothetical protein